MISQIPLSTEAHQIFQTTIPGDSSNLTLSFTLDWNAMAGYWVLGIYDPTSGDAILTNVPLLPGYDLLAQYAYLGLGSAVLVNSGDQSITVPDESNLSTNFALTWEYTG